MCSAISVLIIINLLIFSSKYSTWNQDVDLSYIIIAVSNSSVDMALCIM